MNIIKVVLPKAAEVYSSPDALFEGLKKGSSSTSEFRNGLNEFFTKFNEVYNTDVSLEQVLQIYERKNSLTLRQSIALGKALLDFVQNSGLEVSFENKSYLLRYTTLASVNASLEYSPLSNDEGEALKVLSSSISGCIQKIKEFFRILIPDNVESLQSANIDEYFFAIPGIRKTPATIEITEPEEGGAEVVEVSPTSIKISDSLVLPINISESELARRMQKFDNKMFVMFLDYIYEKMPFGSKTGKKHIDIARWIFQDYEPSMGQAIERVYAKGTSLRSDTIQKMDLNKIKKLLLNENSTIVATVNQGENQETFVKENIFQLRPGVEIHLENDEVFLEDVTNLSAEDVQAFFSCLEDIVRKKFAIIGSVTTKLTEIIQQSEDKGVNVAQKISSLRTKPARVYRKFFDNNIHTQAVRELILSSIEQAQGDSEVDSTQGDIGSDEEDTSDQTSEKKTYAFSFQEEGEGVELQIEFSRLKNIEGFVQALNSLLEKQCERLDVVGLIAPYTFEDFEGLPLDTDIFNAIHREKSSTRLTEMFEIINQEALEEFLKFWHTQVGRRLKESKKVYIEPGSKEELFDFVFQVWQEKLNAIVRKEIRKSGTTRAGHVQRRRNSSTLTEEMFTGVDSLTVDMLSKLPASVFQQIYSRTSKKEVEGWIKEYLDERKKK